MLVVGLGKTRDFDKLGVLQFGGSNFMCNKTHYLF